MNINTTEGPEETKYTKKQLRRCRRYREKRDLLAALLEEDGLYSFQEADDAVEAYQKGMVN